MWDEVAAAQQNGIITGYQITYKSQTENDNGNVQAGPNDRGKELTGLKEFVNYTITVSTSTVKGEGPASDSIVVSTDQDSKLHEFFLSTCLCGFFGTFIVFLIDREVSLKGGHFFYLNRHHS